MTLILIIILLIVLMELLDTIIHTITPLIIQMAVILITILITTHLIILMELQDYQISVYQKIACYFFMMLKSKESLSLREFNETRKHIEELIRPPKVNEVAEEDFKIVNMVGMQP